MAVLRSRKRVDKSERSMRCSKASRKLRVHDAAMPMIRLPERPTPIFKETFKQSPRKRSADKGNKHRKLMSGFFLLLCGLHLFPIAAWPSPKNAAVLRSSTVAAVRVLDISSGDLGLQFSARHDTTPTVMRLASSVSVNGIRDPLRPSLRLFVHYVKRPPPDERRTRQLNMPIDRRHSLRVVSRSCL
ncbi:hypothetical protein B0H63DRAFT_490403 [Podospora didyma]|uniref:Uncharacterized protein n=1 Tax=Podospora didyma TaxID=330526 RepID=A0AAE0N173_9PEZI|nr:hypothetical protein B0H63DRAFT_490403 [Podospora didyma]